MARRRSRSNVKQNILASFIIALVLGLFGTGGFVLYQKKSEFGDLDPETLCPKSGTNSEIVVLIDNSDTLTKIQRQSIKNKVTKLVRGLPKHGGLKIYAIDIDGGLHEPIAKLCNPGDGTGESKIYSNPIYFKNAQQKAFDAITIAIQEIDQAKTLDSSPIMENIQAISIKDFESRNEGDKKIIIISDFIQHVPAFSLYSKIPLVSDFRKTHYGRTVESDFHDIEVKLYVLNSKSEVNQQKLMNFWKEWFELQGAEEVTIDKIVG